MESFHTVEEILAYCKGKGCPLSEVEIKKEIDKKSLIQLVDVTVLFDPYGLLD